MKITKKDYSAGKYKSKILKTLKDFERSDLVKRIWDKDASVWKDGKEYDALIKNRLGWLSLPASMKSNCGDIDAFVNQVTGEGFTHAVVMGMGGSSMCPEVCRETFGIKEGFLKLFILDSTDVNTINNIEESIDIEKTLFVVSSKSGGTIEVDSFMRYFFNKVKGRKGSEAGNQFIAITDPQTQLESHARENNFRKIFINPPDIGGRYSALSYFGLVPAALIGVDIKRLLKNAGKMMDSCKLTLSEKNPGIVIGVFSGELASVGIDKLTFILPYEINSFGFWVEQLIAESTGKEGKGILPVEGEGIGKPSSYGKDRAMVCFTSGKESKEEKKVMKNFLKNNFPYINIKLENEYDLGGQFYLWEFATAVMGAVLEINPFDEPNVKESKDNTGNVLKYFEENKKLPESLPQARYKDVKIYLDEKLLSKKLPDKKKLKNLDAEDYLKFFFKQSKRGDYAAMMAYIIKNKKNEKLLQKIRELIRNKKEFATTLGYGPRFLHSTGQLHKGGVNNGMFIQIISDESKDLQIPGKPYSFGVLKQSQAIGDYESLLKHKRRVIKINIGSDVEKGLKELYKLLKKSI
ncbi:MAG TPA: glucose-6-phosphate isomerase [Ignavibacteria bacterium]|nr:glucose-6-phosphate isomerase [Ignavibacteria bacterium]